MFAENAVGRRQFRGKIVRPRNSQVGPVGSRFSVVFQFEFSVENSVGDFNQNADCARKQKEANDPADYGNGP